MSTKSILATARAERKKAFKEYYSVIQRTKIAEYKAIGALIEVLQNANKPMTAYELANTNGIQLTSHEIAGNLCSNKLIYLTHLNDYERLKITKGKKVTRVFAEILEDGTIDKSHIITRKERTPNTYEIIKIR